MKLFLASSLDKTMSLLFERIERPANETKVLFVANAGDVYEETPWIEDDRKAFEKFGCELIDIDLRTITKGKFLEQIENADILHICGGSVLYILALAKKQGMFDIISEAVKEGKIIYTGTSAGSIITAPSVQLYSHDPEEIEASRSLGLKEDFLGFAFVNFLIKPHMDDIRHLENAKKLLPHFLEVPLPTIMLHDSQAVWVEDDKFELVEIEKRKH